MSSTRSWGRVTLCTLAVAGVGTVFFLGKSQARDLAPEEPPPPVVRPAGGSLVISGGGKSSAEIRDRFVALAGGPSARIVVIPTAYIRKDDPSPDFTPVRGDWAKYHLTALDILHANGRAQADEEAFLRPLAEATGVWFSGGSQARVTETYLGTAFEKHLSRVLERGGVVGGTSAGAAIMTRVMIAGGRKQPVLGQGFDLLPDALVDQHFLRRNRLGRMLLALKEHPSLLGLGIDEETALVVDVRARRARVIGRSYVVACVPRAAGAPAREVKAGPNPLVAPELAEGSESHRLEFFKPGDEADLNAFRSTPVPAIAQNLGAM